MVAKFLTGAEDRAMRVTKERLARLALLWSDAVGSAGLARLVAHFGGAWQTVHASREELGAPTIRLRPEQVVTISTLRDRLEDVEELWRECERQFIHVVFLEDDEFPRPLAQIPNAPAALTVYGAWLPGDDPAVAVVGTRSPTPEGVALAEEIAAACAHHQLTVVSGLAEGIDQAAHCGVLKAHGRTLAVVGCGLLAIPRNATNGMEAEVARQGAVMSEVGPYTKMSVPHLMARNRLTSGLARAVIVVQSRGRGGSLVTAEYGAKQGRSVFAVPWPSNMAEGIGTGRLLKEGARVLRGPDDVAGLANDLRTQAPGPVPEQLTLFEES